MKALDVSDRPGGLSGQTSAGPGSSDPGAKGPAGTGDTAARHADPALRRELLAAIPRLRAFAVSLCGRSDRADDLVQETLVRAWANLASFQPGTNLMAWLYTILRNEFYTEFRKRRHEVQDEDGVFAGRLTTAPTQEGHIEFQDFRAAMARLADDQREALILIGASGLSYEDAAQICGCAVGTMKSRVHRARFRLADLLSGRVSEARAEAAIDDALSRQRAAMTGRNVSTDD